MSYDHALADRIREAVGVRDGIAEKEMFGGVAWMLNGNMLIGIVKNDLMVRVGAEAHEEALALPHARPMDFSGRPMNGYVYVAPAGVKTEVQLREWMQRAAVFVATLPPKELKGPATPKKSGPPKKAGSRHH